MPSGANGTARFLGCSPADENLLCREIIRYLIASARFAKDIRWRRSLSEGRAGFGRGASSEDPHGRRE